MFSRSSYYRNQNQSPYFPDSDLPGGIGIASASASRSRSRRQRPQYATHPLSAQTRDDLDVLDYSPQRSGFAPEQIMVPESRKRVRFGGLFSSSKNSRYYDDFSPVSPPRGYPSSYRVNDPFMYRNRMYDRASREQLSNNPEYVPRWMRTPGYEVGPFESPADQEDAEEDPNAYSADSSRRRRRYSSRSVKGQQRLLNSIPHQERQNLIHNFQRFDSNGDGYITPQELQSHLKNKDGSHFSAATVRLIYRLFNSENNDGYLDLNEFYVLLKNLESWNFQFNSMDSLGLGKIDFTGFLTLVRKFGYRIKPETCSYIYKMFAKKSSANGSAFSSFFGVFGNNGYYQNNNNIPYRNGSANYGKKYLMKFDKFFECSILLTYFYNQYEISEMEESIDLDGYLMNHFYSYCMQQMNHYR